VEEPGDLVRVFCLGSLRTSRTDELTEDNRQLRDVIEAFKGQQPSTASLAVFMCHGCCRATDTIYQIAGGEQVCAECFSKDKQRRLLKGE